MSYEREHIDLFTGIGGFSLAAQANGVRTIAQCEADTFLAAGLLRAWGVEVWPDVRHFPGEKYRGAWLLSAGVPCQPASQAGDQLGEADHRWLWPEAIRVTEAVQPHWAIFENPPGIDDVGLGGILSELGGLGYEIGICRVPACAVNSPQDRDRFWIVANRSGTGQQRSDTAGTPGGSVSPAEQPQSSVVGHPEGVEGGLFLQPGGQDSSHAKPRRTTQSSVVADGNGSGKQTGRTGRSRGPKKGSKTNHSPESIIVADGDGNGRKAVRSVNRGIESIVMAGAPGTRRAPGLCAASARVGWRRFCNVLSAWSDFQWVEVPRGREGVAVCRAPTRLYGMAHGLSAELPRGVGAKLISALGNAIVWPVAAELIGAMIKAEENL